jgi:acyl carrier protein
MKKPTREDVLNKIRFYLADDEIKEKDDLSVLGYDSLERMDLHMTLEDEFNIRFDRMSETSVKEIINITIKAVRQKQGD